LTIVTPHGNRLPAGTPEGVMLTPLALSVAVGTPSMSSVTSTVHVVAAGPVKYVWAAGTEVNVGGTVSRSGSIATCGSLSLGWSQNSAFTCTMSVRAPIARRRSLTRM